MTKRITRPVAIAAAATGLAGAFLAGTLVNGSGSGDGPGDRPAEKGPRPVAFTADLAPARSCDDLLEAYVERARELVGPWGWGGGPVYYDKRAPMPDVMPNAAPGMAEDSATAGRSANEAPSTERQVNSETGTNVQEAGVDEPDTVKTDGSLLVVERHRRLDVYDVSGATTEKVSSVPLTGIEAPELLLAGDTVVVFGGTGPAERPGTRVLTVSLAEPAAPEVTDDVRYTGRAASVRQHGDVVRLVLAGDLPDLDFVEPRDDRSEKEALAHNREVLEKSTIEDWLPSVTVGKGGKEEQLLDCRDVAVPTDELALGTTSVVGFEAGDPGEVDAIGLAGLTDIAYESADHLYLASGGGSWGRPWGGPMPRCLDWCDDVIDPIMPPSPPRPVPGGGGSSYLFDFELDGTRTTHVASGQVEGAIRDRWSLDEAGGVLRVAVGPTSETGNFNSVLTMERDGQELVERGRLDGLGPNEDIQSVRWFDDLAIVVTFRRTDPLYAVDLTDTTAPRLLSKLKIPGFSSYLHPLGGARMIGVGEGPDGKGGWGAQVGLFDVRDTAKVTRLDVLSYGNGTEALAGADPRAFTWLPDHRTALTMVQKWNSRRVGYVSVLRLAGGRLHERRVKVEYGDDVDRLRAVPLPDGRVVLITGDDAEFFSLTE